MVVNPLHNAMRPVAGSGAESYKYIAKNLINAVKQRHGLEYYVRGTCIHKNLDFTKTLWLCLILASNIYPWSL